MTTHVDGKPVDTSVARLGPAVRYTVAVVAVGVAVGVRLVLSPVLGDQFPFATLFPAILLVAGYGGLGPALAATVLGAFAALHLLLPQGDSHAYYVGFALYVVGGTGIAVLGGLLRAARDRAEVQRGELTSTLASLGEAVVVIDARGLVVSLNPMAEAMTGWRSRDAAGQPLAQVVQILHMDTRALTDSSAIRVLREGTAASPANHALLRARDGSERPIDDSAAPVRDPHGRLAGAVLVIRDVTHRRAAEAALRDNEQVVREQARTLSGILAATVDHVYVVARDGRYRHVSAGGARLLGQEPQAMAGKHWRELGLPAEVMASFDATRDRVLASGVPSQEEATFRTASGEQRHFEYIVIPIAVDGDQTDAVVAISRDVTERKRAEAALREVQGLLDAVIDHAPACIFAKDRDGRYLLANRALAELVGHAQASFAGRTDRDFFSPEVAAQFARDDAAILAAGAPRIYEESFPQGDALRTYLTVKFPLRGADGQAHAVCAVAVEITELKRTEAALRSTADRLHLALTAARLGDWRWDFTTDLVTLSERAAECFGVPVGPVPWATIQGLLDPEDRARTLAAAQQSVARRGPYDDEYQVRRPDGTCVWVAVLGRAEYGHDGQPLGMLGVLRDITSRKQGEQAALRSERDARFLADASAALAGLVDDESTLQKVARLAVPHFSDWCAVDLLDDAGTLRRVAVAHVDASKVGLAHDLHRRYPPDPNAPAGVWNILRTGRSELVPELHEDMIADPEVREILRTLGLRSYMGVPLAVRGRVMGVITFIAAESGRRYDPHDLAMAEDLAHRAAVALENAQLYHAARQADRRKDEFLALLGHELRNPLAPIRNALQVLKQPGADATVTRRAREVMERQVEHMVRLVDDLLDVSRIMQGKVELRGERLELATVVAHAVETTQPAIDGEGHQLTIAVAAEPLVVHGDLVRLAQLVANLLHNAAKYTDRGGRIWLTLDREGEEALLRVRDDGIGIRPELLPHLFDMFFQAERRTRESRGGLGLGLSLVKGLAELHGGSVTAHSAGPGTGSEFVLRLPLVSNRDEASESGHQERSAQWTLPPRRVLVVDDNVDAADSLAMLLGLQGQEVRVAYDGQAALAAAEQEPPVVAFLDLGMPMMDGYELARRFRHHPGLHDVVLVALTGWGQPEDRARTRDAGFDHHLVKPVDPNAVEHLLSALPSRPRAALPQREVDD